MFTRNFKRKKFLTVKGQITQDKACWKCAMKKRLKQIYNNISFPAQASDFTLKIFSSMVSDKVYDIYILAHMSNRVFSKHSWKHVNFCLNSLTRQILIKNNLKKRVQGFTVTSPPTSQLNLLFISFTLVSYFRVVLLVAIWLVTSQLWLVVRWPVIK